MKTFNIVINIIKGFPDCTSSNEPTHAGDVRDTGLIPGSGRSLEKEMAIQASILAWGIPWSEESGKLQSMELYRVGHF